MKYCKTVFLIMATASLVACGLSSRKASRAEARSYGASENVSKLTLEFGRTVSQMC